MKRLRFSLPDKKIRFFHCGEYGDKTKRPHYHAIIFGHDFSDKQLWRENAGNKLYISPELDRLWGMGISTVGPVTYQSAAYVARYIMKKVTGDQAQDHYQTVNTQTGELHSIQPEYVTMSRRPGIARAWFDQYKSDLYPKDFVTVDTKKHKIPKFYDRCLEAEDIDALLAIKSKRTKAAKKRAGDNTPARLQTREKSQKIRISKLVREI